MCCSVLQCVAGCCSEVIALQCVVHIANATRLLQCVVVCCRVLQGVAGCRSVLQCAVFIADTTHEIYR